MLTERVIVRGWVATTYFFSVSGAGDMHDAASTPYLTLVEASEEATFLPTCSGKTVGKRKKKTWRPHNVQIMVMETAWLIYLGREFILRRGFTFSEG